MARRSEMVLDGPFVETKEVMRGFWPASWGRYAPVNGLRMYYEVHGRGRPLVLLHGALNTIEATFQQEVVRALSTGRRVIAIEQQAHGRTADIDRPLTCEQMADDTAELLRQLDITEADFFGYSMGGAVALQIGIQHPGLARRLAVVSSGYGRGGYTHERWDTLSTLDCHPTAELLSSPPFNSMDVFKEKFERVAVQRDQWSAAMLRASEVFRSQQKLRQDGLRAIKAPTLLVAGEEGLFRPEHAAELADLLPRARLARFPGNDHDPAMVQRSAAIVPAFLDADARLSS